MLGGPRKFLYGVLAGAGLMYLLDPDRGRRRRALLRDQLAHARHEADELGQTAVARSRDLRNRARGFMAEAGARMSGEEVDDAVLVERVRSAIGRTVANPGAIDVIARHGVVTLAGRVLAGEVRRLVDTAGDVRGVRRIEQQLEVHESPEGVPDLQGAPR